MSWIAPIQLDRLGVQYINRVPASLRSKQHYTTTATKKDAYKFANKEAAIEAQEMCLYRHRTRVNHSNIERIQLTALPVEEIP